MAKPGTSKNATQRATRARKIGGRGAVVNRTGTTQGLGGRITAGRRLSAAASGRAGRRVASRLGGTLVRPAERRRPPRPRRR